MRRIERAAPTRNDPWLARYWGSEAHVRVAREGRLRALSEVRG